MHVRFFSKWFSRKSAEQPPTLDWRSFQEGVRIGRALALKENSQLFQVRSQVLTSEQITVVTTEPLQLPSETPQDGQERALRPGNVVHSINQKNRFLARLGRTRLILPAERTQTTDPIQFANLETIPAHTKLEWRESAWRPTNGKPLL